MSARTVLVTGASTGIGEAIARRMDGLGYRVFAGVRAEADAERLRAGGSTRLHPLLLDVTAPAEIRAAAETISGMTEGRLDALVNNAGIAVGGPLEFVPIDQVRLQFEVNVLGLLAVTQAMLPLLRRARGRIVHMGSIAGRSVVPMVGPYCASKHAVEALTDGMRLELYGSGIEVSVVEPGAVKTPIWNKGIDALAEAGRRLPPAALERYGRQLAFFAKLLAFNERRGVAPDLVVDAVLDAIESERPRTRYLVGSDARIRALQRRLLPDRWADALLLAVLRRLERTLA